MLSIQELQSSTPKELQLELEKARNELLKTRISVKTKHVKDSSKVNKSKAYVAQILTVLRTIDTAPVKKDEPTEEEK